MNEHTHEHYEPGGVSTGYVLIAALGALVLLAGAIGGLYAVYAALVPNPQPPATACISDASAQGSSCRRIAQAARQAA